MVVINGAMV